MALDSHAFRQALGQFATGVCVVSAQNEAGQWEAMTINSFASVSLEPALILWSIQNNSQCFDVFTNAKTFVISVLSSQQMAISNHYATPDKHQLTLEHAPANDGIISGAIATFSCRTWANNDGGDHRILIGEVTQATTAEGQPLLFAAGNYRELADTQ